MPPQKPQNNKQLQTNKNSSGKALDYSDQQQKSHRAPTRRRPRGRVRLEARGLPPEESHHTGKGEQGNPTSLGTVHVCSLCYGGHPRWGKTSSTPWLLCPAPWDGDLTAPHHTEGSGHTQSSALSHRSQFSLTLTRAACAALSPTPMPQAMLSPWHCPERHPRSGSQL